MLQSSAKIDPRLTYNITHDSDNNVTGIVWMMSYIRENFERFGNSITIDVMKSQVCNTIFFCYIDPVVLNEVGKINVVCEGFVISKSHDVYCFILNSIFKRCVGRGGGGMCYIFLTNLRQSQY